MNERFIESSIISFIYQKKLDTKGSYYQVTGKGGILPRRISLGIFVQKKKSVRDCEKKNEINGQYRKTEAGIYKELNKGRIHSSIWEYPEYPLYYGYGIIDERHNIFDLLIFYSEDNCKTEFEIHLFRGMGKPEYLSEAFKYLQNKKKPLKRGWG